MALLRFITASTSGHTDYVVDVIMETLSLDTEQWSVDRMRAEQCSVDDLALPDALILGSGTWNTGGQEGQLNMHMDALLRERAAAVDLQGKYMSSISLGDDRYYFRTRCTEHILRFMRDHHGQLLLPPLVLVNEPYGQEERIRQWAVKLSASLQSVAVST